MAKRPAHRNEDTQLKRFKEAARAAGCDEGEEAFKKTLKGISKSKIRESTDTKRDGRKR